MFPSFPTSAHSRPPKGHSHCQTGFFQKKCVNGFVAYSEQYMWDEMLLKYAVFIVSLSESPINYSVSVLDEKNRD